MDDLTVIQQYYKLRSCRAVGELYNCSEETIRRLLKRNNIKLTGWKRKSSNKTTKKQHRQIPNDKPKEIKIFCEYCGKKFIARSQKAKYCSKKCHDTVFRLNHGIKCNPNIEPYHKICVCCGKEFETFRESTTICSHECALEKKRKRDKEQKRERHDPRYKHTLAEWKKIQKDQAEKREIERKW